MPDHFEDRLRAAISERDASEGMLARAAKRRIKWLLEPKAPEIAALVEAARKGLDAWRAMPDAGLAKGDPRFDWWNETIWQRLNLEDALAALDGAGEEVAHG